MDRERHPDFVIITMINEEFNAVKEVFGHSHFEEFVDPEHPVSAYFLQGDFFGQRVVLVKCVDKGNMPAGNLVTRIIDHWEPTYILLVGIGGGVKDVGILCGGKSRSGLNLGDIVISKHIEYYEYGNIENKRTYRRVFVLEPPTGKLREIAQGIINSKGEWKKQIKTKRPDGKSKEFSNAHEGIILSGDKVVNDPDFARGVLCSRFERESKIVFETEGAGVARAIYDGLRNQQLNFLVIRGISDFVDVEGDEKTRKNWRVYAAQAAAAFVYELIRKIGEGELKRRRQNLQPYLNEAKRLFEEKNPIDGKALKDYYVEPRVIILPVDTWDMDYHKLPYSKEWNFKSFLSSDEYYIVIGAPFGVGKTTYVKHLAYELSRNFEKYNYVPLFVKLKDWNEEDLKHNSVQTSGGRLLKDAISKIIEADGNVILILDGLDEFHGSASAVYRWIMSISSEKTKVIITTRLKAGVPKELHIKNYVRILPFDEEQVNRFFERYGIEGLNYTKLTGLGLRDEELRKPLFCWMLAVAFSNQELKDKFISFYESLSESNHEDHLKRIAFFYYVLTHLLIKGKHKRMVEAEELPLYEKEKRFLRLTAALMNLKRGVVKHEELEEWIKAAENTLGYKTSERLTQYEPFLTSYFYLHPMEKGRVVEFIHQSFQDYFLAEYYYEHIRDGRINMLNVGIPNKETIEFLRGLVEMSKDVELLNHLKSIDKNLPEFFDFEKQSENAVRIIEDDRIILSKELCRGLKETPCSVEVMIEGGAIETVWVHRWIALNSLRDEGRRRKLPREKLEILIRATSHLISSWLKDLSCCNLERAGLRQADLSWAKLSGAILRRADLRRANLSGAELSWADLSWANLNEADLRKAILRFIIILRSPHVKNVKLGDTDEEIIDALANMDEKLREVVLKENPKLKKMWEHRMK